jgi:hypothetical protein
MSAAFILLALSAATATEPHSLGLRSRRGSTRGRSSRRLPADVLWRELAFGAEA